MRTIFYTGIVLVQLLLTSIGALAGSVNTIAPPNTIFGPHEVFTNTAYEYTFNTPGATTYNWTVQNGTVLSGQGTTTVMVMFSAEWPAGTAGNSVSVVAPGGAPATASIVVFSWDNVAPELQTPTSISVCGGHHDQNYDIIITPNANAAQMTALNLVFPDGIVINFSVGQVGYTIPMRYALEFDCYASSGTAFLVPVYPCGEGNPALVEINVNPQPAPPGPIMGPQSVCPIMGGYGSYSITPVPGAESYAWTLDGGTPYVSQSNEYGLSFNAYGSHTLTVTPYNSSCALNCNCSDLTCDYCGCPNRTSELLISVIPDQSNPEVLEQSYVGLEMNGPERLLVFDHCNNDSDCPQEFIEKAYLNASFDMGDDYEFGEFNFGFQIAGYFHVYDVNGLTVDVIPFELAINDETPEALFRMDITQIGNVGYSSFDHIVIDLNSLTGGPPMINYAARLKVFVEEEILVNVQTTTANISLVNILEPPGGQTTFVWQNNCEVEIPNYEFQLLRLYNRNDNYQYNPLQFETTVDWSEALTIETQSSATSLTISVVEGEGYYVWRVRPIGNFFEGGIANSSNWGMWSEIGAFTDQNLVTHADIAYPMGKFITPFDINKNWVYSRTFSEGDFRTGQGVRIAEGASFANGLNQTLQQQRHLQTDNYVIASQSVYDFSGRAALQTLPVPLDNQVGLGYRTQLLKSSSNALYTANDFDSDANYHEPSPAYIDANNPFGYYSDFNPDQTIPSAEGFPFSRSLFYQDGTSRLKESGMPGETLRIKNDAANSHTSKTLYAGVSDTELIRIFGDEAPTGESCQKIVSIDNNGTASVTYIGKDGKTIATCLARNGVNDYQDPNSPMVGLESQSTANFNVTQYLTGDTPYGDYGSESSTVVALAEQTSITINYEITPSMVTDFCTNYCSTCDYYIQILVQNITSPHNIVTIDPDPEYFLIPMSCENPTSWNHQWTTPVLEPGSYKITRRITAMNHIDGDVNTTYLDQSLENLQTEYESHLSTIDALAAQYLEIEEPDIIGFYSALGGYGSGASSINLPLECGSMTIPVIECNPYCTQPNPPTLYDYMVQYWGATAASSYLAGSGYDFYSLKDLHQNMINQMVLNEESQLVPLYNCQEIWNCWMAVVQSYPDVAAQTQGSDNIVEMFLQCVGVHYIGVTNSLNGNNQNTVTPGSNGGCSFTYSDLNNYGYCNDGYLTHAYMLGYIPDQTYAGNCADETNNFLGNNATVADWTENDWLMFVTCVNSIEIPPAPLGYDWDEYAENECEVICDDRYDSFVTELWNEYHADGFYIQNMDQHLVVESEYEYTDPDGDIFYEYDMGLPVPSGASFISEEDFLCNVGLVVDYCKSYCQLNDDISDAAGHMLVPATQLEAEHLQKAMTFNFDIENGSSCGSGYEAITAESMAIEADPPTNVEIANAYNFAMEQLIDLIDQNYAFPLYTGVGVTGWTYDQFSVDGTNYHKFRLNLDELISGINLNGCHVTMDVEVSGQWAIPPTSQPFYLQVENNPAAFGIYWVVMSINGNNTILSIVPSGLMSFQEAINTTFVSTYGGLDPVGNLVDISLPNHPVTAINDYIHRILGDNSNQGDACYVRVWKLLDGHQNWDPNGTNSTWYTTCRQMRNCGPLCFKWKPIEISGEPVIFEPFTCEQVAAMDILESIEVQSYNYIHDHLDEYEAQYINTCSNPENIQDQTWISYPLGYHHYTLYYHDRAGNLIKTVPPAGVDLSSTTRMQHPNHGMVTEYYYNSMRQKTRAKTPDAGVSKFYYNSMGELRFSQSAQQVIDGKCSYIRYDNLGRIIESGQTTALANFTDMTILDDQNYPSNNLEQQVISVYDAPAAGLTMPDGSVQRYLTNRISYTYTGEGLYTYYSYDPHGNVAWLVQEIPDLGKKYIHYEYDLVSGNVTCMVYNPGEVDQFAQKYEYDADNRLIDVYTSRNQVMATSGHELTFNNWENDAHYDYYKHGPNRRLELGEDKVQGLDYVYNIMGWLKGINHPKLSSASDPSNDGFLGSHVGRDAFGMTLGYFEGDFNRTGSMYNSSSSQYLSSTIDGVNHDLYNGNISTWVTRSVGANYAEETTPLGQQFVYDQLNRIKSSRFNTMDGGVWTASTDLATSYAYDANGNLINLQRKGTSTTDFNLDNLAYMYQIGNNRLAYVADAVSPSSNVTNDFEGGHAYNYDANGNLISDIGEDIGDINWTATGKVKSVTRTSGSALYNLEMIYNAQGTRAVKVAMNPTDENIKTFTYHITDMRGNVIATYTKALQLDGDEYMGATNCIELPIYGKGRVGLLTEQVEVITINNEQVQMTTSNVVLRNISKRLYEVHDHLNNVRILITDLKITSLNSTYHPETFEAQVTDVTNYYPFGMTMPVFAYHEENYRYGFNGMERDVEMQNNGEFYVTDFRYVDCRIARWISTDPVVHHGLSPYNAFDNNPIYFLDPSGADSEDTNGDDECSDESEDCEDTETCEEECNESCEEDNVTESTSTDLTTPVVVNNGFPEPIAACVTEVFYEKDYIYTKLANKVPEETELHNKTSSFLYSYRGEVGHDVARMQYKIYAQVNDDGTMFFSEIKNIPQNVNSDHEAGVQGETILMVSSTDPTKATLVVQTVVTPEGDGGMVETSGEIKYSSGPVSAGMSITPPSDEGVVYTTNYYHVEIVTDGEEPQIVISFYKNEQTNFKGGTIGEGDLFGTDIPEEDWGSWFFLSAPY
jgi:RHS repeat-associated protein